MTDKHPLFEMLDDVAEAADGRERLTLGDLTRALDQRGFGPVVLLLGALLMLPTSAIPGLPAVLGLMVALVAAQLFWGRARPWLPERLRRVGISRRVLRRALDAARPVVRRLARVVRPRLRSLAGGQVANRFTAMALLVAGVVCVVIGFIPFLPFTLGIVVLCFGIGMTAEDGLFTALGLACLVPAVVLIWRGLF